MERRTGTISRGIRCPIIREGDDLAKIVCDSVVEAAEIDGFELRDKDVVAVTESILARSQGNYASVDAIAKDVKAKLGGETVGVIFPILSRNRFAICLKGIAMGCKKVVLMLSYPSDEVGNHLLTYDQLDEAGVNPYSDVLSLQKYRELFGENKHEFTGVDYVDYYSQIIKEAGAECEVVFANQAKAILDNTDCVLTCDIHTRARTKRLLKAAGAKIVCGMDDILTSSVDGSGFNADFGLLGSNKSTEDMIKLFPKDCGEFVNKAQQYLLKRQARILRLWYTVTVHSRILRVKSGSLLTPAYHPVTQRDLKPHPTSSSSSILQITTSRIFQVMSSRRLSAKESRKRAKKALLVIWLLRVQHPESSPTLSVHSVTLQAAQATRVHPLYLFRATLITTQTKIRELTEKVSSFFMFDSMCNLFCLLKEEPQAFRAEASSPKHVLRTMKQGEDGAAVKIHRRPEP